MEGRKREGLGRFARYSLCGKHGNLEASLICRRVLGDLAPHRESQAVPGTCGLVQGCHAIPGSEVDVGSAQAQGSNHVYGAFCLGSQRQGGL